MSERSNQLRESVDRNLTLHMRDVSHFFGWVIRSLRMRLLSKLGTECKEEEDSDTTHRGHLQAVSKGNVVKKSLRLVEKANGE
jgi:hypothetical protein